MMIVERRSNAHHGFYPEAVEILDAEFQMPLYHRELKLRLPLGIYNASLINVFNAFDDILSDLVQLLNDPRLKDIPGDDFLSWAERVLISRQKVLLYSLMEHMEDCFNILKCFVPLPSPHPHKRDKKAYMKASPAIDACINAVEPYWTHISNIVNHMKHNQGRLRLCFIHTENVVIPGYFVESCEGAVNCSTGKIEDWEVVGPSSVIHGKNRDTAFSFARDLRYHFVNVYLVSKELANTVNVLTLNHRTPRGGAKPKHDHIVQIANRLENLPLYLYRDELRLVFPSVKVIDQESGRKKLRLSYPDASIVLPSPEHNKKMPARTVFISYGISTKVLLPYMA